MEGKGEGREEKRVKWDVYFCMEGFKSWHSSLFHVPRS